jgi:pimeloyl-ACP methyl ester carboxylesterase
METRGTGTSEKPNHGYRMARIAKDVYDMLISLKIEKAYFMGHSMGANVILSFIDLFGQNMIKKFILCDQAPWLWSDLNETDESMILHGGHRGQPYELKKGYDISWEEGQKVFDSKDFFPNGPSSLADSFPNGNRVMELEGIMKKHFKYDSKQLVKLCINHYMTDWRDILPIIDIPTLIITGETTFAMDLKCADYLHKSIKNSELVVFTKEDKGNHIMMANNPEKFNKIVIDFLKK